MRWRERWNVAMARFRPAAREDQAAADEDLARYAEWTAHDEQQRRAENEAERAADERWEREHGHDDPYADQAEQAERDDDFPTWERARAFGWTREEYLAATREWTKAAESAVDAWLDNERERYLAQQEALGDDEFHQIFPSTAGERDAGRLSYPTAADAHDWIRTEYDEAAELAERSRDADIATDVARDWPGATAEDRYERYAAFMASQRYFVGEHPALANEEIRLAALAAHQEVEHGEQPEAPQGASDDEDAVTKRLTVLREHHLVGDEVDPLDYALAVRAAMEGFGYADDDQGEADQAASAAFIEAEEHNMQVRADRAGVTMTQPEQHAAAFPVPAESVAAAAPTPMAGPTVVPPPTGQPEVER